MRSILAWFVWVAAQAPPDGPVASSEGGWPQFRGPRRDGVSTETGLLKQWPAEGPRQLWKVGELGHGWSSPIIAAGRLYVTGDVGDALVLRAFDSRGQLEWRATHGRSWTGQYPGARACPVYSEGRLYLMNAHGRVACFDGATGRELWATDVLERFDGKNITWAMSECLLVDGPRLIVTPGGRKALMAALDKRDGRTIWTTEPIEGDAATYASPILVRHGGRRLLISSTSGHGFAADADTGKLLWKVPLKNEYGTNVSSPVYGAGQVHFATAYFNGSCYRLEADGAPRAAWTSPFDTCTGGWVLADGVLYGSGYSKFKHWIGVDWSGGKTTRVLRELTSGAAIWADGRLYCLAQDGRAALVSPAAEGFSIVSAFQFAPAERKYDDAWAHPVLVNGRLYLRFHDMLACYDVKAK